jgi:muramoyltetrapeptide carboxypeptidase
VRSGASQRASGDAALYWKLTYFYASMAAISVNGAQLNFKVLLCLFILMFDAFAHSLCDIDIEIIAPSSGVCWAIWQKIFKITGTSVEPGKISTKSSSNQIFADHEKKLATLRNSLTSRHKIIWSLRGGYGVDRIMPGIVNTDYSVVRRKTIIGYSDMTPLLIFLSQKCDWTAIHGVMLNDIAQNDKSYDSYAILLNFLRGKTKELKITGLTPMNGMARTKSNITGKVIGGNLTCIVATIGTTWQIETYGKIVLLEDIGLQGYHLDRALSHMENAGLFKGVVCIIFGDFCCNVSDILKNFAEKIKIPVYKTDKFGHGKVNLPFVYNSSGTVKKFGKQFEITMKTTGIG